MNKEETKWCYYCGETKPATEEYWYWTNKEHIKLSNKCKKCNNYQSMISHRINRAKKKGEPNNE